MVEPGSCWCTAAAGLFSAGFQKFGVKSDFLAGYRVTDGITMDVAERALFRSGQ
jgi:acetylglutamate kinase